MSERVKPPDTIWLQYCKDGSLGQFWWAGGDAEYIRRNSTNYCTPEERSVIDAALAWLNDGDDRRLSPTQEHLLDTLTALLTSRRKSEVSK